MTKADQIKKCDDFVSGFGPKPLSRQILERGEVKTASSKPSVRWSNGTRDVPQCSEGANLVA